MVLLLFCVHAIVASVVLAADDSANDAVTPAATCMAMFKVARQHLYWCIMLAQINAVLGFGLSSEQHGISDAMRCMWPA
jgi:hypothetical protein